MTPWITCCTGGVSHCLPLHDSQEVIRANLIAPTMSSFATRSAEADTNTIGPTCIHTDPYDHRAYPWGARYQVPTRPVLSSSHKKKNRNKKKKKR